MRGTAQGISDIVSVINEKYTDWCLAYRDIHRDWVECYEFLDGNQWAQVRDNLEVVRIPRPHPSAVRIVENLMGPVARVAVAKLLASPYEPQSEPLQETTEAMQQAKAQDAVLSALAEMTQLHESVMKPAALDFLVSRLAITRTMWRPFVGKGEKSRVAGRNANLSYYADSQELDGYVYVYSVSPLRWLPAPWSTYDNIPEVIEVHTLHKEYMEDVWGADACKDATPVANASTQVYGPTRGDTASHYRNDLYLVYEYFRLPTNKEPLGRQVICTNGRLLYDSNTDKEFKAMGGIQRSPYAVVTDLAKGAHLIGRGLLLDAVPLQKALNSIVSQTAASCNRAMATPMTIPKDSKIEFNELVGGSVIQVDQAQKGLLGMIEQPRFPAEGFQLAQVYRNAIPNVVGVHDTSQGEAPGMGAGSGKAIGMLASLDATKFGPMAEAFQRLHITTYENMVEAWRGHVGLDVALQIIGPDKQLETVTWYANNLSKFRLRIRPIPAQFKSLSQHREDVLRAWQMGLIKNPELALSALGLNDYIYMPNDERLKAREENAWFRSNEDKNATLPTAWWEDSRTHGLEHKRELMSVEFAAATKQKPWIRIQLEEHLASHARREATDEQGLPQPEVAQQPQQQPTMRNPSAQGMAPQMFTPGGDGTKRSEQHVQLDQAGASGQGAPQELAGPAPQ